MPKARGSLVVLIFVGMTLMLMSVTANWIVAPVSASTNASGHITINTTWTLAESPYIVVGDVTVDDHVALTIEPGVVVKFTAGRMLVIVGGLIAHGNATHEVTFTTNATAPAPGDWGGIVISPSARCNIADCIIEYATNGIDFENAELDIDNCTISNNALDGIYEELGNTYPGLTSILNSRIENNGGWGINIKGGLENCNNTKISNNSGGVCAPMGRASIYNCNITDNKGDGILRLDPDPMTISGSIISNNSGHGIWARRDVNIQSTTIVDNGYFGICSNGGNIHFCNVYNNHDLYDVQNIGDDYWGVYNIDAAYNWWGTTNETLIRERIYDYSDNSSTGVVSYVPFLNSTNAILAISTSGVSLNEPVYVMKDGMELGLIHDEKPINITFHSGTAQPRMGTFSLSIDNVKIWDSNPNTRYKFVNWTSPIGSVTSNSITITITANSSITAFYKTQYLANFTFNDNSENTLYVQPSWIQLIAPNSSLTKLTTFQNRWLDQGTWTIKQILWQGNNVKPTADPIYSPVAGGAWVINCRVYLINFTDSFKDSDGTALYVGPSSFRLAFPNGTTSAPLPIGTYLIQNGTTTWYSIIWQNMEVVPIPASTFDATNGNPTINCRVYFLTAAPIFYDNTGMAPIQPSSWSIRFPNGTIRTVSSPGTYILNQPGNCSITSITWQGSEVSPDTKPTIFLNSSITWTPTINCKIYSLTIDPAFYDNTGTALVQPSSWSITFPNGTARTVSSLVTYDQTQAGNYSIVSVTWKGTEVVPDIRPATSLSSDSSWSPSINCLLPTNLYISLSTSTSYIGFKVEIKGNLTCNDVGLLGTPILLDYSVTGGVSWDTITLVNTISNGDYSALWIPSATGNYLVRAIWSGNATYPRAAATINLAVTPFREQNVFSVTSNSTISELTFNSTSRELGFTVTGPTGTTGYINIYIAKTLIDNIANLKVYLDGDQLNYAATSMDDSWFLHFTYTHSMHKVTVSLGSISTPFIEITSLEALVGGILIAGVSILIIFFKRRQIIDRLRPPKQTIEQTSLTLLPDHHNTTATASNCQH